MPIPAMTFDEFVIAQGLVWRAELGFTGVTATTGVAYAGVLTGADEICVLQRAYSSSEATLQVDLFEATFSVGTDPRVWNRRLSTPNATNPAFAPATVKQGVTPGTLGSIITGTTLRAGTTVGTASISLTGDESRLYLKPNTSYVVRYSNLGSGAANIGNAFDFRKVLKGPWDAVLISA